VEGDVVFGKGVIIRGSVVIANRSGKQVSVADKMTIEKDLVFD
jgi:hypothetical protein